MPISDSRGSQSYSFHWTSWSYVQWV